MRHASYRLSNERGHSIGAVVLQMGPMKSAQFETLESRVGGSQTL